MPIFANPAGLWALLGLPVILAIHFLQQRARVARTSTWFLIEKLSPDSARGRTWDRIRSSRILWLQLASIAIAAWVLAEPRWVRAESAQTVVIVLDASASMDAFRAPAVAAAEREMSLAEGLAAHTTWVVMTTNARQPALYRGPDRAAAAAGIARWQPELGQHDLGPALRLARSLAGGSGRSLLITDRRAQVPPDQRAAGVGRAIDNVGFAGASVARGDDGLVWRALVKNHATIAQRRTWHLESGSTRSPEQTLELAPAAMTEISARFPDGADEATVVLSADAFSLDDRLPLVRPAPKALTVIVDGKDDAAEFFRKVAGEVEGVTVAPSGSLTPGPVPRMRLARLSADELAREPRGGIFWPPADQRAQAPLATEPVTPERDSLVDGLNWQGWLGTGPHGYVAKPDDAALLWQGRFPLVLLRTGADSAVRPSGPTAVPPVAIAPGVPTRKLLLAFDWATSNAARLPATVLLLRRFIEAERDAQRAPYTANFDCNSRVPLPGVPLDAPMTLTFRPATATGAAGAAPEVRTIPLAEVSEVRAPGRAGLFRLQRGDELLVRGAAQFADARQSDFRNAERFFVDVRSERQAAIERNTRADPFAALWLLLLAALVLWSWWTRAAARSSGQASAPKTAKRPVPAEVVA
jgi:hypothetical protein